MTLDEYIKLYYQPEVSSVSRMKYCREEDEDNSESKLARKTSYFAICGAICGGLKLPTFKREPSFSDYFFEILEAKGIDSHVEVYKKCCMTKQTFSRIMNPKNHPSKHSVLALCIGLELNEKESAELLARAGFAFNPSDLRDVIVQYFIKEGIYDMDVINEALYKHDEDVFGEKE